MNENQNKNPWFRRFSRAESQMLGEIESLAIGIAVEKTWMVPKMGLNPIFFFCLITRPEVMEAWLLLHILCLFFSDFFTKLFFQWWPRGGGELPSLTRLTRPELRSGYSWQTTLLALFQIPLASPKSKNSLGQIVKDLLINEVKC